MDNLADNPAAKTAAPGGSEAAAILLMMLGDEEASQILAQLDPQDVQSLGVAMFNVADVTEDDVAAVFDEFAVRARATTTIGFGAAPRIRSVMQAALGSDRAETVLARITPPTRSAVLDSLRWMDARTIAAIVEHEHPQIAAVVLAHLDPAIAADVLQLFPPELQPDLIHRVATMETVSAEALDTLEQILVHELARVSTAPASARGGASEAAKIMNNTRPGNDKRIIKLLGKIDRQLAQKIEDEMFVFDDLLGLDDKNLGILLRSVDNEILIVALKGTDERLRERMLGCMSARAADSIRDEMAERGPIRLAEVQDAQKSMLTIARQLAEAGTLMLAGRGDDYV